jgi:hypothetical protein
MALGYACVMGIYLDDMLAGVTIVNNTMQDVQVSLSPSSANALAL